MTKTARPTSADAKLVRQVSQKTVKSADAEPEITSLVERLKLTISNRGLWLFEVMIMADSDKDTLIQKHELGHLLDTLHVACTPNELDALFSFLDSDSSGSVSLQELKRSLSPKATTSAGNVALTLPDSISFVVKGREAKAITEDEIIDTLKKSQGHLEHINLSRTCLTDEALMAISKYCPKLKVLVLVRCPHITDKGIFAIGRRCERLQCINLSGSPVTAQAVNALIRRSNDLRAIVIDTSKQCNEGTILALAHHCPLLEAVDIDCSAKAGEYGISQWHPDFLFRLVSQCQHLTKFRVHGDCNPDVYSDMATFVAANQALYPDCRMMNHTNVVH